jgi:hypothetical protein
MSLFELWCRWLGLSYEELKGLKQSFGGETYAEALWNPPSSEFKKAPEKYQVPFLDNFFKERASFFGVKRQWQWKCNAPYVVCVTHDVDRIFSTIHGFKKFPFSISRLIKDGISQFPGQRHLNSYCNWERQRQWENDHGIKSASFILFEKRRWKKSLIEQEWQHSIGVYEPESIHTELKQYEKEGNEIGLHYSFDSWKSESALHLEIERMKSLGLKYPRGGRSHYLNFSPYQTLRNLKSMGMRYDSTMGFNYFNGFRCGTSFPYLWNRVWELPLLIMDSAWRSSGKSQKVFALMDSVKAMSGVLMLNWHHHTMNESVFPDEMKLLETIISQAKKEGAWIATPSEIVGYLESKSSSLESKKDEFIREQYRKGGEIFL